MRALDTSVVDPSTKTQLKQVNTFSKKKRNGFLFTKYARFSKVEECYATIKVDRHLLYGKEITCIRNDEKKCSMWPSIL
jgi:hypothetical protein